MRWNWLLLTCMNIYRSKQWPVIEKKKYSNTSRLLVQAELTYLYNCGNCTLGASVLFLFWNFNGNQTGNNRYCIGKTVGFYFLQFVLKCTVFGAFAYKVCKRVLINMTQNNHCGHKSTQNFMLISNSLMTALHKFI